MTITTEIGALNPIIFRAPAVNPSPGGLWNAVSWTDTAEDEPSRFLTGVEVLTANYDGQDAAGVWGADWCAQPDDLGPDDVKDGVRAADPAPYDPITVWGFAQCDLTEQTQAETRERAVQNLRLNEQQMVEREFAARLLADAGTPTATGSLVEAVSILEAAFAKRGIVGVIHASARTVAFASFQQLLVRTGSGFTTPSGHRWVFGGGYVDGLDNKLVATSGVYGWRDQVAVRETIKAEWNQHVVIAERSVLVAYEHAFGAVALS